MSDLGPRLRRLIDDAAPPVDLDRITRQSPKVKWSRPRRVVGYAAGAIALVGATVVAATLFSGDEPSAGPTTVASTSPSTVSSTTSSIEVTTTHGAVPSDGGLTEIWSFPSASIGRFVLGPDVVVTSEVAAVTTGLENTGFAVVDLSSGDVLSRTSFSETPGTLLAADDARVYWATTSRIGASSFDGTRLWEAPIDAGRWPSRAVLVDDSVLVSLSALSEPDRRPPVVVRLGPTGSEVWMTELSGVTGDEELQWVDMVVVDATLVVQSSGAVYGLALDSGEERWRTDFSTAEVEHFTQTGITVEDGVVYVADPTAQEGQILGVDADSGETVLDIVTEATPRIVGVLGDWLIHTDEAGIHGRSLTRQDAWVHPVLDETDRGPLVAAGLSDGLILYATRDGVGMVDRTGEHLWFTEAARRLPRPGVRRPIHTGSTVIVPTWEGTFAVDPTSGEIVAEYPAEYHAPTISLGPGRALVAVAGTGLTLVEDDLRAP